jgi:steroid delta-isomerase-like uncharacterized protein
MSEENKALSRRALEQIVNQKNLDAIDEFFSADCLWHQPDQDLQGPEQAKHFVGMYLSAFPDTQVSVEDVIAEGDRVVTRVRLGDTHQAELMGIAPTQRQIEVKGVTIHRVEGGKIVEQWQFHDDLGLMRQIGAVPEPKQEGVEPSH